MSRCPFWSTVREKIECYKECPMLIDELSQMQDEEQCIFKECTESSNNNFRNIEKEEYNFLNFLMYEDEKTININY